MDICQVTRKTNRIDCLCCLCSVSIGCVKKQLFANVFTNNTPILCLQLVSAAPKWLKTYLLKALYTLVTQNNNDVETSTDVSMRPQALPVMFNGDTEQGWRAAWCKLTSQHASQASKYHLLEEELQVAMKILTDW